MGFFNRVWLYCLLLLVPLAPACADVAKKAKPQMTQNERWNLFFKNVYKLHLKQIKGRKLRKETRIDGYRDDLKFYKEVKFFDADTGQHISTIQWERRKPYRLHTVQVNIYNKDGKLVRDYSSAYLPVQRAAPIQTLLNFHGGTKTLKAFRQFDASGYLIYEACRGTYKGKKVDIGLEEDDLYDVDQNPEHVVHTETYKVCFKDIPKKPGLFLHPQ